MILLDDKYRIELNISHEEFIDKLLKTTEIRENLDNDAFPNKKKYFLGNIDYNSFSLVLNRSAFNKIHYKIYGNITQYENKIQIVGSIKGYIFSLLFNLCFSLFSLGGTVEYFFFINGQLFLKVFFCVLLLIGASNFYVVISNLKRYKMQFIEKIASFNS